MIQIGNGVISASQLVISKWLGPIMCSMVSGTDIRLSCHAYFIPCQ